MVSPFRYDEGVTIYVNGESPSERTGKDCAGSSDERRTER